MSKRALILLLGAGVAACGKARADEPTTSSVTSARGKAEAGGAAVGGVIELEHAFEHAAATIAPSVVSITSTRKVQPSAHFLPFGGPFEELFGGGPTPPPSEQTGLGSGVIVDDGGHILTNNHVVDGAETVQVVLHDERKLDAQVIGTDPQTDLAVIKVEAEGLVPARLGNSESLRVGQWVIAYGNPFGLSNTVSSGIVSAVGRGSAGITEYGDFIQTDAAINPGNSGGPLIDLQGRVVGINTAIASRSGGSNGIGFAIPIHMAKPIMEQLLHDGKVDRGWLGIMIGELDKELAHSFGYQGKGILVQDVLPEGPGGKGGLRNGDIIISVDGRPVTDLDAFRNYVASAGPGTAVALEVWRDGSQQSAKIQLGELPDPGGQSPASGADTPAGEQIGIVLRDLTPDMASRLGLERQTGALIVEVQPGSPAAKAGLRPGDIVLQVGNRDTETARAAKAALAEAKPEEPLRLRVQRGQYAHYVILPR